MYVVMLTDPPSPTPNLYGPFETREDGHNWADAIIPADNDYIVVYVRDTDDEDEGV